MRPEPDAPASIRVDHPRYTVLVRAWRRDDAPALARAANHEGIARHLADRFPYPYGEADAALFLDTIVPGTRGAIHAIQVDGEVAGGISIAQGQDIYRAGGELGYWLTPSYWRRGLMAAVIRAYVPLVAAQSGLSRVHARVFEDNPASMALLEKCGFQREGVQRRAIVKHGRTMDLVVFARLFGSSPE